MKVRTMRGREIDMVTLMAKYQHKVALGNASMNARGDIVGKGGKIVKPREKIIMEYNQKNPTPVRLVGIKSLSKEMLKTPAEVVADARAEQMALKPESQAVQPVIPHRKRKLIHQDDDAADL